jgi:hypothetical protein
MKICQDNKNQLAKLIQEQELTKNMNPKTMLFISRKKNKQVNYADVAEFKPQQVLHSNFFFY